MLKCGQNTGYVPNVVLWIRLRGRYVRTPRSGGAFVEHVI